MKKTHKQIEKEIQVLTELKDKVVPETFFGDNNLEAIDAQIRALEEDMTDDQAWEIWPGDDDERLRSSAEEAIRWRDGTGETNEPPHVGWPLKKDKK